MRALKVFGSTTTVTARVAGHHGQARVIVSATSVADAIRRLNESGLVAGRIGRSSFAGYWAETGNDVELSVASGEPGVWYGPDRSTRVYVRWS